MIVLFLLLMLVNCTLPNSVLLEYRYEVAGLPINILDGLVLIALLTLPFVRSGNAVPTEKSHTLLALSVSLLVVAIMLGVLGALAGRRELLNFVTVVRNAVTLPAAILIGYYVPRNLRLVKSSVIIALACSLLSAILVLVLARAATASIEVHGSFDQLRAIHYGGEGGNFAAAVLVAALIGRVRLLPMWPAIGLVLFCEVCAFAMPHRSLYLAALMTILFASLVVPSVELTRRFGFTLLGLFALAGVLVAGLGVMSAATGRNFTEYVVEKRLKQMVPGFEDQTKTNVTDTRWAGIQAELEQFAKNPLLGQGLGVAKQVEESLGSGIGMNHNVWTAMMAQCGIIGLAAYLIPVLGCIVVGWKLWRGGVDRWLMLMGALGAANGVYFFTNSTLSMAINVQRPALLFGILFGLVLRARDVQLALAQEYAGYLEPGGDENSGLLADAQASHF